MVITWNMFYYIGIYDFCIHGLNDLTGITLSEELQICIQNKRIFDRCV